jgi:penicillin-binding protein 1A
MDSIRKIFNDIKAKITLFISGVKKKPEAPPPRGEASGRPAARTAAERRDLYTYRARTMPGHAPDAPAKPEAERESQPPQAPEAAVPPETKESGAQAKPEAPGRPEYAIDARARAHRLEVAKAGAAGNFATRLFHRLTGDEVAVRGKGGKFKLFSPRVKPPNAVLGVAFTTLQLGVFALLLLCVVGVGAVVGIANAYMDTSPVLDVGKIQDQDLTSFIYDGNGKLITTYAGMENRVWATIDEIPVNLQNAIVAIEDSRFYTHDGVDIKRIIGSFLSNMSSDSSQGGSTITQQLIKNTIGSSERTYKRKIQEAWLAMELEKNYNDKKLILEAYLNTIPLGQSNYGVKAAAEDYFGKTLDKLTLRECAMLAGLAQSPYLYDPRSNTYTRNRMDITDKRTNTVLLCMYQQEYITKEQYDAALQEAVTIQKNSTSKEMYDMPYFVEYAIEDIKTHLLESRGQENTRENRSKIDSELRTGGYKIYLTVDPEIQKAVEDTLYNWKKYPKMRLSTDNTTRASDGAGGYTTVTQPQAAAVVLDYHTGQLKAIVGGRQQPKIKRSLNRAYQATMPVGSCIKPLAVYGPAIDKGLSPASIVYNVPAKIDGWNTAQGFPDNYSGSSFTGATSVREGLRNSYNVIAARLLLDEVGLDNSVSYLQKMGIQSKINKDGPGLALGTTGVTLVEMTGAFGTFGNEGEYIEPLSFTKVVDSKGGTVLDADKVRTRTQVFKPSTAWMMVDMMTDVIKSGTGTRAKISGMTVAGKTGTNSDFVGVSFNGITPYYTAAVWVGSDKYKPLTKGATGGTDAAPLWKDFMQKIVKLKDQKNKAIIEDTPASLGLVKAQVCGVSGKLVTEACKTDPKYKTITDWFLEGTVPTEPCNMHYTRRICKLTGKLATEFCPESDVEESSILLVPQDSVLRRMKPADILKYFPNAVLEIPGASSLDELTPDNPLYAQYFCTVHTQEWADLQPQYTALVNEANSLVSAVKTKMSAYAISDAVHSTLNAKIKAVEDIIAKGFTDPAVPPQTAYDNLLAAVNDLDAYADTAFIEPSPTPWWEPSPSPSISPEPSLSPSP